MDGLNILNMSSGNVSDAGDVGEGEGPKVVQSSFKDASIMNRSIAPKEQPPPAESKAPEEVKAEDPKVEAEAKDEKPGKKKQKTRFVDDFDFEIPKMKGVPILNKDTVNPYTFDINYLLNPDVQKVAKSAHRLTMSTTAPNGKTMVTPKNHIKKNIANSKIFSNSKSQKEVAVPELAEKLEKRSKCDVEERFYKKAKQTEEKIKNLKEEKEKKEVDGCTFKPEIKAKREKKTYEEFYEYMKRYNEKKEKKITHMKEEESKAKEKSMDFSHHPKLCEKSLQMIARKSDLEESTFDRLHKLYKLQNKSGSIHKESITADMKHEEGLTFHPTVNKKSQVMNRSDPVEKILYDDALRRINKDKNPPALVQSKFITSKSEKVLIEKLKRDFEDAFVCIDAVSQDQLNYTKMIEMFKAMHFIKDDYKKEEERLLLLESWKILLVEGETYCKKSSILVFLIAVMGFYEDWMGSYDPSRLVLTPQEANKIHVKFDLFYSNRVSIVNKSTLNKSYKNNYDYSFHPQTVIESENMAKCWRSQNRTGGKIEDMLIAEKAKTLKKLEEKRAIMDEQALDECSFQPIIEQMPEEFRTYGLFEKEDITAEYFKLLNEPKFQNKHKGIILHDLAKIVKQRKETISSENSKKREELELENCTFAPKLEDRIFPSGYSPPEPRKKISENSPKAKFSGSFASSDSKVKASHDLKKKADNENEPVTATKNPRIISNNGTVAVVGITVGGKEEKLSFNISQDDPSIKVLEFSQQFGLKKEMEYKLVKELTLLKTY